MKLSFTGTLLIAAASLFLSGLFLSGVSGCGREGPAESAGEKVDEAVDNIREAESPFHKKGPAEKAGETIAEAIGR